LRQCMTLTTIVHGCMAFTMIDMGSTTNFVSPAFAMVTKLPVFPLEQQITLQLGCIGSQSKLSHGTRVRIQLGPVDTEVYMDIANIDHYDCILGIPFLREHGMQMDFTSNIISINDVEIPTTPEGDQQQPARARLTQYGMARIRGIPPLREVNHTIPLIVEERQYTYHMPKCPDSLRSLLATKTSKYTEAGWWEIKGVRQAAPMMCIPKKNRG
ncbi:hypothetical protein HYDPIDRAFT_74950, partial [Hydnomerulius pinastri MD-312]